MSFNFLDVVKDQLTGSMVSKLGSMVGADEGGVTKALSGLIPTVVGTIASKASDENGASGIMDMIKNSGVTDMDPSDMFGDNSGNFMEKAGGVVSGLFGDKTDGIVDQISSFSGIGKEGAGSLLGAVSSMATGALGKHVMENSISPSALSGLVGGQSKGILSAIPGGLGDMVGSLGIGNIGDMMSGVTGAASGAVKGAAGKATGVFKGAASMAAGVAGSSANMATSAASGAFDKAGDVAGAAMKTGKSAMRWVIPVAIIAIAAGWWFFKGGADKTSEGVASIGSAVTEGVGDVVDGAASVAGGVADAASGAASAVVDVVSGSMDAAGNWITDLGEEVNMSFGNFSMNVGENSCEAMVYNFLNGNDAVSEDMTQGWMNMSGVFFETGSANLTETSKVQIQNMANIMNHFSDCTVKIGGYTDNTGNPEGNIVLSKARASAVVSMMTEMGVDASRVMAEGYGNAHPTANNDTPEGRAQNRRVACRVMSK